MKVGVGWAIHKLKLIYLTRLLAAGNIVELSSQLSFSFSSSSSVSLSLSCRLYPYILRHNGRRPHTSNIPPRVSPCVLCACVRVCVRVCVRTASLRIIFGIIITMSPCFACRRRCRCHFRCPAALVGNFSARRHRLIYCLRCLARSLVVCSVK